MEAKQAATPARAFAGATLRPARSLRVAYGLLAFWTALVVAVVLEIPELRLLVGGFGAVISVVIAAAVVRLRAQTPRAGGRLEAREDGLHVEGRLAIPQSSMTRADLTSDARGPTVSIQRANGMPAVIDVESPDEGRALVTALGLDAAQALSTFDLDSPVAARVPPWGAVVYLGLLMATVPLALLMRNAIVARLELLLALTSYIPMIAGALPARLSIGLDGVLIRWAWRRRLLRFEEIRAVTHDGERVHLELTDGRRVSLAVTWTAARFGKAGGNDLGFASKTSYLEAIVARVDEALEASRARAGHQPVSALMRQGRSIDVWVTALRAILTRGAQGFRDAQTVPERLWTTVENGGADPTARAAAAIALGPSLDDAERDRLRRVARVVVSPRLRITIEAAIDGGLEDAAAREALAALDEEREPSTAQSTRSRSSLAR